MNSFGEILRGTFLQPTFITDYPRDVPLTKCTVLSQAWPSVFELMVNGKETCNAYSELNDPIDREKRFIDQMKLGWTRVMTRRWSSIRTSSVPLQHGMPPTSGIGIGIDRWSCWWPGKDLHPGNYVLPTDEAGEKKNATEFLKNGQIGVAEDWVYRQSRFNLISDIREESSRLAAEDWEINKK